MLCTQVTMLAVEEMNANAPAGTMCAALRSLAPAIFKQTLFTLVSEEKEVCQEFFKNVPEASALFNQVRMFADPIHAAAGMYLPHVDRHSLHNATSMPRHFILAPEEKVRHL